MVGHRISRRKDQPYSRSCTTHCPLRFPTYCACTLVSCKRYGVSGDEGKNEPRRRKVDPNTPFAPSVELGVPSPAQSPIPAPDTDILRPTYTPTDLPIPLTHTLPPTYHSTDILTCSGGKSGKPFRLAHTALSLGVLGHSWDGYLPPRRRVHTDARTHHTHALALANAHFRQHEHLNQWHAHMHANSAWPPGGGRPSYYQAKVFSTVDFGYTLGLKSCRAVNDLCSHAVQPARVARSRERGRGHGGVHRGVHVVQHRNVSLDVTFARVTNHSAKTLCTQHCR